MRRIRRLRRPPFDDASDEPPPPRYAVVKGNEIKICYCFQCKLHDKTFTISPPTVWRKQITWHYAPSGIPVLRCLITIYNRKGTALYILSKDLFYLLLRYIVRAYTQDIPQDYRKVCDDCQYYHREIR